VLKAIDTVVKVEGLTKTFGRFCAVDDVAFEVTRGEMVGLVGPNGAGKTTIIHTLLGLITPDAGRASLFGEDLFSARSRLLQKVNFCSPYVNFPNRLTVTENLRIYAKLYGVASASQKITELLETFRLSALADRVVSRLSSGEVTRMALCKAFLSRPDLLLLDEPTAYMDPFAAKQTRATLVDMQRLRGVTILLTSHNMREVQEICDRVILLDHGRIVASGSAIDITRSVLREHREAAALDEVFLHLAARSS
jgi:ABC-2 type transport system ATP-binding protein